MVDENQDNIPEQEQPRRGHPLTDAPKSPPPSSPDKTRRSVNLRFPETVKKPYITYTMIGINLAIWGLQFILPSLFVQFINMGYMNLDAVLVNRQIYRLFTAMFLHIEFYHVMFNCMAIYYIGQYVERFFGYKRYLLIYLLGGLGGSVLSILVGEGGLGASGAVMAIWGADIVFWYRHRQLFGKSAINHLRYTGFIIAFNFAIGFLANAQGTARIGNFAHLGGLLGGAILAWFIGPRFLAVAVKNPKLGQVPIRIMQVNPLMRRIPEILFYSAGLASLLVLAILMS